MKQRQIRRYSEAFKRHVVSEYERGDHASLQSASEAYGVRGNQTLKRWVLKYGKKESLAKVIRVERPEEVDELKRVKEELRQAKEALADAYMDKLVGEEFLKIACRRLGEDPHEFKKKTGGKARTDWSKQVE